MPTLDIHGLDAYYSDQGEGMPVILTLADCSSGAQWRKFGHQLGPGFRMLALDQYDHGRSQPWGRSYDYEEVDLLKATMESVEEPVHLVGHGFGHRGGSVSKAALNSLLLLGNPTWGFLYRKVATALKGEP